MENFTMMKVLILGLLKKKPMHGYKIQEELKNGSYKIWANINPNSIYSALRTLERKKLVNLSESVSKGNQTKSIYRITDLGRSQYYLLLEECISSNKTKFPADLYIGMSFITDLSEVDAIKAVNKRIDSIEQQLSLWNYGKSKKIQNNNEITLLNKLFENGISHLTADYKFLIFIRDNISAIRTSLKELEKEYIRSNNDKY